MVVSLFKSVAADRALELVDFLVLFLVLAAAVLALLLALALLRARKLHRELVRSSEETYYNLLPTLALNAEDHALIKRLAGFREDCGGELPAATTELPVGLPIGALCSLLEVEPEVWRKVIRKYVPAKLEELNLRAFEAGRQMLS